MPVTVTVFGGTGFLGRAVVARLLEGNAMVRIAVRHPARIQVTAPADRWQLLQADVRDEASTATAIAGAQAVVNAVGLYVERRHETFEAVHIDGARIIAEQAATAGVEMLVHVSGIGADTASPSKYVRARAEGERVARNAFAGTIIVRPSVLFGCGDAFLGTIDAITRAVPVFPLFGDGSTRLQPVFVDDVADGITRIIAGDIGGARVFEFGGPDVLSYRSVVEMVLRYRRRKRVLLPVSFPIWSAQARVLGMLPNPPLTADQVILMRGDNVVGDGVSTFSSLGIVPNRLEAMLPACLDDAVSP